MYLCGGRRGRSAHQFFSNGDKGGSYEMIRSHDEEAVRDNYVIGFLFRKESNPPRYDASVLVSEFHEPRTISELLSADCAEMGR